MVRMSLQHAVLGVLEAREMTGYELTQFFEASARWVWTAPQSQIYPLLRQMEGAGLIAGEEQVRGSKLKRTSYAITEAGLAELRRWLAEPHSEPAVRDPFLLQTLFLDMVEPEQAEAVLREHIAELQQKREQWAAHRARLAAIDTPLLIERLQRRDPADHARIVRLKTHVFDYLIESAEHRIRWAEEAIDIVHHTGAPLAQAVPGNPSTRDS
jgi:DNA-binding PadR family transcriptional regulator